jgi:hypothetical protein
MSDIFDFGFTAVDEDELESVRLLQQQTETVQQELKTVDNRAKALYDAVLPLLENLKSDPSKDYIYWPNRYDKIDAFQDKLAAIMTS